MLKSSSPNHTFPIFGVSANISERDAYFSKLIFVLKPQGQACRFQYHEAFNPTWEGGPNLAPPPDIFVCCF